MNGQKEWTEGMDKADGQEEWTGRTNVFFPQSIETELRRVKANKIDTIF